MPYFAHMLASKMHIQTGLVALHAHVNAPVSLDAGPLRKSLWAQGAHTCVHDIEKKPFLYKQNGLV
jgi:hypothetical protein